MRLSALVVIAAFLFVAYAGFAGLPWWTFVISAATVVLFHGLVLHIHGSAARRSIGMPGMSSESASMMAGAMVTTFLRVLLLHGAIYFAAYGLTTWLS